jgi:Tfp pilus assembly PilM family ATPase
MTYNDLALRVILLHGPYARLYQIEDVVADALDLDWETDHPRIQRVALNVDELLA